MSPIRDYIGSLLVPGRHALKRSEKENHMASYDDLRGKTALVTGASNGIGAATATLL
jgi:hypothetical protein